MRLAPFECAVGIALSFAALACGSDGSGSDASGDSEQSGHSSASFFPFSGPSCDPSSPPASLGPSVGPECSACTGRHCSSVAKCLSSDCGAFFKCYCACGKDDSSCYEKCIPKDDAAC